MSWRPLLLSMLWATLPNYNQSGNIGTEAQCAHVYCYVSLQRRKTASINGDLTCPKCMCIALNIIHHQPIRLDDGFPYQRNILQEILGRSDSNFCSICHEWCKIRDTDLGTMDTTKQCPHVFCFNCLSTYKRGRIEKIYHSNVQIAGQFLMTLYVMKSGPVMTLKL